jgi:transposase
MDAVVVFGEPLIDDPARFGMVNAVGLDETLCVREGRYRRQRWSTQVVDVQHGQLLDMLDGKDVNTCCAWFTARPTGRCEQVRWATLDLSSSYRTVFDTMPPPAVQVADPFHVVRLRNTALDECRQTQLTRSHCPAPVASFELHVCFVDRRTMPRRQQRLFD